MAGQTPALQQNLESSEKSQHFKGKTQYLMNTLYILWILSNIEEMGWQKRSLRHVNQYCGFYICNSLYLTSALCHLPSYSVRRTSACTEYEGLLVFLGNCELKKYNTRDITLYELSVIHLCIWITHVVILDLHLKFFDLVEIVIFGLKREICWQFEIQELVCLLHCCHHVLA